MADDYSMSDFVTPGQVEAQRAMAKALLEQSLKTPVSHVGEAVSPFAIGTQMTQALMGRMGQDQAGQQERGSYLGRLEARPRAPGTIDTSGRRADDDTTDPSGKALASLESGGNYRAVGDVVKTGSMAGQRPIGKYQVMEGNIPIWTQEFLGHRMTPGEFLNSPEAQEIVRKGKFAQYEQKFGPEGAARAWLGGPGGVTHPGRADQHGTTIGQYGQNYMARLASNAPVTPDTGPGGGPASAYAAEPAVASLEPPDAPAPVSKALMGGGEAKGETKVAGGPRGRAGGAVGAPAGAVQARPHMTWEQYMRASAGANEAEQARLDQIYMEQHAPIPTIGEYGQPGYTTEAGKQHFYPGPPQWIKMKKRIGDTETEVEVPIWTLPPTRPGDPPTIIRGDERDAEPTTPAVPGPAPLAPREPLDLSTPEEPKKGSAVEGGAKYAALTTGDTMTDAGPGPAGPLAVAPPATSATGGTDRPVIPTEAPPAATKEARMGDITPQDIETGLSYSAEKERRTKAANESERQMAEYGDSAKRLMESTNRLQQQISESRDLVQSGLPIMGPWSRSKRWWNEFLAAGDNPEALARVSATEAMEKNVASEVLADMKTQLEKMGQVRIAEIDLLKTAMANPNITPRANLAILNTLEDYANMSRKVAEITEHYQNGERWDAKGHPILDKDGNPAIQKSGTANELRDTIAGFVQRSPLYTTLKSKEYLNTIDPDGTIRAKMKARVDMEKKVAAEKEKGKAAPVTAPNAAPKRVVPGIATPPGFE